MRTALPRLLCLSALASLAFGQTPARDRHVVMISIDGFAAYALQDATLPVPNIRRLMREGASAESMQPVNPTVTWPNHTTLVTGVTPELHTVLYNGQAVRGEEGREVKIEPHVYRDQLVQGVTVYDVARQAGLTTAEVDWVAVEKAAGITWSFAEWPSVDGAVEKEMLAAGLATADEIRGFTKAPITFRDELWTRVAEHLITQHKPNLLLLHLLTTDSVQHRYGARSLAAYTALELADAKVGRLVEACRKAGILPQTTFLVVSDHGFRTHQKVVRPNAMLARKNLGQTAWVISEGGTAMVYVTRKQDKDRTVAELRSTFQGAPGIKAVLGPDEFTPSGYPYPAKNERMADLVLTAADGFAFDGALQGENTADVPAGATPGGHGFLNTDPDMQAIFVASGAGVKPGAKLGRIKNVDVAPTVARLLGVSLPSASGKALAEILR